MDVKNIFAEAKSIRDRCEKANTKLKELFEVLSPTNYPPFFESDEFSGFLHGIKLLHPALAEDLGWFFHEISFDRGTTDWQYTLADGKEFHITGDESFVELLEYQYGERTGKTKGKGKSGKPETK